MYLDRTGTDRDSLDPILDSRLQMYLDDLDEDGQVDFRAKGFCRY